MPIYGQNTLILSKLVLWGIKVKRMPFFSDFSRKTGCSHSHILSKIPVSAGARGLPRRDPSPRPEFRLRPRRGRRPILFLFCEKSVHESGLFLTKNVQTLICQKNVQSLKNKVLSCRFFFFKIFHKNLLLSCPYMVKIR